MTHTVRHVTREIIARQAPEELDLLDGTANLSHARVTRLFRRRREQRDPLGFGVAEVAALATPVVWLIVDSLAQRGADAVVDGASRRGRSWLRALLRRPAPERTVPALLPEQHEAVHRHVLEQSTGAGLDDDRAAALADAVVARLAQQRP